MKRLNSDNFQDIVSGEKGLFVVKFFSPTCGPCSTMKPVFEALEEKNPGLNVYEVDTMESPELASHFGVRGVPYTAFCENREVLYDFTGVTPLGNLQFVVDNIDDPYFRETGEFQKAEVKKTWWFEATVALLILLFVGLLSFSTYASDDCSQLIDDCEYYSCVSESKNCSKRSYLLGFGQKYCLKFDRKKKDFTNEGQLFIDNVKECLIRRLDEVSDLELSCRQYKETALSHHMPCYLEAGYCSLPTIDRNRIIRNVVKSMWRPSLVKSGLEILTACKKQRK